MRYLAVGDRRAHVLHAIPHLQAHAGNLMRTIDQLSPTMILVDRSKEEWANLGSPDPLSTRMISAMGESGVKKDIVWMAIEDFVRRTPTCRIGLLHDHVPPVPEGRGGLKTLDKLVKKEGFDRGATPVHNLKRLYFHYMKRCPALWEHVEARRDHTARAIRRGVSGTPQRPVVVLASPDVEEVCLRARQSP